MTETLLMPTDVGAAVELLDWSYRWEFSSPTADNALRLKILSTRAFQLASGLKTAWDSFTLEASVWEHGYYESRMRTVAFLARMVVDILTRIEEIRARTHEWHPEEGLASATDVRSHLEAAREIEIKADQLLQWLRRPRHPVNEAMVQRSREQLDRGEGEAISEILARLESGGPLVKE